MKLTTLLGALCSAVLATSAAASTFERNITMSLTSAGKGAVTQELSIKEGYMRVSMAIGHKQGAAILDFKNQQILILMPEQQMYMVQPIPQPSAANAPAGKSGDGLVETGTKDTILGYECTKYTVTSKEGTSEIWVTDQLGTFAGLFHGGPGGNQPPPAWENALKGKGFFPLKVVGTSSHGTFTMEVTKVEKTSLPDSLFEAPAGWRKFDLGAMMGGAGGGMPPGFPGQGRN
jgi:Domain of unknown function (DUF4412)